MLESHVQKFFVFFANGDAHQDIAAAFVGYVKTEPFIVAAYYLSQFETVIFDDVCDVIGGVGGGQCG